MIAGHDWTTKVVFLFLYEASLYFYTPPSPYRILTAALRAKSIFGIKGNILPTDGLRLRDIDRGVFQVISEVS